MSLQGRLAALVTRVAKEVNEVRDSSGVNRRLAPWHLTLANPNVLSSVFVIGDSVGEGAVTSDPVNSRWQSVFAKALRDEPGGEGYLPAWFASPFVTNPATFSHTPVVLGTSGNPPVQYDEAATSRGPASRRIGLQLNGWAEWTFTGTQVRVWYDPTTFFGRDAKIFIDGVEVATITANNADGEMFAWNSPVMPRAKHTIRVQEAHNLGGSFWLEAVQFFDQDSGAVQVYDGTHSGATAQYFSSASNPWPASMQKVFPSLVIIMLGFNDMTSRTPAQFTTDLRAVVARVTAALTTGSYSLAIIAPWSPAPPPSAGWAAYVAAMETVANEHPNGVCIRLIDRWPLMVANQNNPGMFGQDTVHPSEYGQVLMGQYLAASLGLPGQRREYKNVPRKQEISLVVGPGPNWFILKGEYEIPPGAVSIDIDIQGPGSGGGSGRRGTSSSVRCGGGGGGGGGHATVTIPVAELPAGTTKLYYQIPPPGAGGAGVTTNDTDGNAGQNVSSATFVSRVQDSTAAANLVASVWYASNSGGKGGTATSGAAGASTVGGTVNGVSGGSASTTGSTGASGGSGVGTAGGGGAGGGITSANAGSNGGSGGYSTGAYPSTSGGAAGTSASREGKTGNTASAVYVTSNGGGGGGAAVASGAGGANGGNGGDYGGGGGGGSAALNGYVSGAGGDGGKGYIRFIARF